MPSVLPEGEPAPTDGSLPASAATQWIESVLPRMAYGAK